MDQSGEFMTIGGHRVVRTSAKTGAVVAYECHDCGMRGDSGVFVVGIDACPGRPESLNTLSVCPGGEGCRTHMDRTTAEWREWKASSSMPAESVPHYTCEALERGGRAADHFLSYVGRSGMAITSWELSTDTVFNQNAEGALVATFRHAAGAYELWVGRTGRLTALRTGSAG